MVGEGSCKMLVNSLWSAKHHTPEDRLRTQMRYLFLQELNQTSIFSTQKSTLTFSDEHPDTF